MFKSRMANPVGIIFDAQRQKIDVFFSSLAASCVQSSRNLGKICFPLMDHVSEQNQNNHRHKNPRKNSTKIDTKPWEFQRILDSSGRTSAWRYLVLYLFATLLRVLPVLPNLGDFVFLVQILWQKRFKWDLFYAFRPPMSSKNGKYLLACFCDERERLCEREQTWSEFPTLFDLLKTWPPWCVPCEPSLQTEKTFSSKKNNNTRYL